MHTFTLVLLATALASGRVHAQLETVTPGSRVRVSLRTPKAERIDGELVARIRDTVAMQGAVERRFSRHGPMQPRALAVSRVDRIDISVGRAPFTGALQGAVFGAAASVAYGSLIGFMGALNVGGGSYFKQQNQPSGVKAGMTAAIAVVPICALIRAINAPDKWRRVYPR